MLPLILSFLSSGLSHAIFWQLRVLQACNPELHRAGVPTLSRDGYTIVFWPARTHTQSLLLERQPTNTGTPST